MAQSFFPINQVEVTSGTTNAWTDVDVSAYVPANATGVILRVENLHASTSYTVAVRKNGSTDDRLQSMGYNTHAWCAVGVDANRIFEEQHSNSNINIYLVGYTMAGVTFLDNGVDKSLARTGSWTDIDCSAEAPAGTVGIIFEVYGGSTSQAMGLRKNGSTDARVNTEFRRNSMGVIIGCDANRIVEGYAGTTDVDFWIIGYVTDGAVFNTNATNVSLGETGAYADLAALPANSVMGFIEVVDTTTYSYALRPKGSAADNYLDAFRHPWAIVGCDTAGIIEGKIENTNVDFFVVGYALKQVAELTGTVTASITESDVVAGGKTIILTLTNDTWIAAGAASFDLQRANIIAGLTSAQSEALGWNNVVKVLQAVTGVVRTSDTVVTITLDAQATYDITATETITATIPATALTGGVAVVATPTFTITATAGAATIHLLASTGVGS